MPGECKSSSPGDVLSGQIPDWMDARFFQKALRVGREDAGIRVVDCEVHEALGRGENYVSIVYGAVVTEECGRKHHLIVKCLPSNEARKMISNRAKFFRKEIDMYGVVFPAYRELHAKLDTPLPWPRHYFSTMDGNRDYLVMEDLRETGFVMRERLRGLDRDHLEAALATLAEFHAYSIALKMSDPEAFQRKVVELYPETVFTEELRDMMGVFVDTAYKLTASAVREWGGSKFERIANKIDAMADTVFDEMAQLLVAENPGAVLTHGDFWVNNMMFKYGKKEEAETGSGKPVEVKLVDFQISRYSSPAVDLMYLMVTSITGQTRREHWNHLLEHAYLCSFWNTLESLGHKGDIGKGLFSWEWLQGEFKRFQPFALMTSMTVSQAVLAEVGKAPDMDALTEDDVNGTNVSPFAELAKGSVYQERLRDLLEEFDENGLFE